MIDVAEMIVLSTGECLCEFSDDRLKELKGNSNKLAKNLGRTAHYERKNRSNIECLQGDLHRIEAEVYRRRALTTLTMCGFVWHWRDTTYVLEGRYETQDDIPSELRRWSVKRISKATGETLYWTVQHPVFEFRGDRIKEYQYLSSYNTIYLTQHQLTEARRNGAKVDRLADPLASPWKIGELDEPAFEDAPWTVAEGEDV